jgi:hypothetical protein
VPTANRAGDYIIVTRNSPLISCVTRQRPGQYRIEGGSFIGGGASHDATREEACRAFGSQSALGAFDEAHQGIGDGMMCTVLWRRMPERHRSEYLRDGRIASVPLQRGSYTC